MFQEVERLLVRHLDALHLAGAVVVRRAADLHRAPRGGRVGRARRGGGDHRPDGHGPIYGYERELETEHGLPGCCW